MAKLVELKAGDRRVASSRLTAGARARQFIRCLVQVQPRKTGNHPDMTEKLLTGMLSIKKKKKKITYIPTLCMQAVKALVRLHE